MYYFSSGSLQVLVQSQSYNATVVYSRIKDFLGDYYNSTLNHTSFDNTFASEVEVMRISLQERDPTLSDRTSRYWSLINSGVGQFDYRDQMLDIIDSESADFSEESLRGFYYDNILNPGSARELLTVLYGEGKPFKVPEGYIEVDYEHLNQTSLHL